MLYGSIFPSARKALVQSSQRPWQGPFTITKRLNDLVYSDLQRDDQEHLPDDDEHLPDDDEHLPDDDEHLPDDDEHQLFDDYGHQLQENHKQSRVS